MLLHPSDANHIFTYRRFDREAMRSYGSEALLHSLTEYALCVGSKRGDKETRHEFVELDKDWVFRATRAPRFKSSDTKQRHPKVEARVGASADELRDHVGVGPTFEKNIVNPRPFPKEAPRIVVLYDCGNGFSFLNFEQRDPQQPPPGEGTSPAAQNAENPESNWAQALPNLEEMPPDGKQASDLVESVILSVEAASRLKDLAEGKHQLWEYLKRNGYLARTILVVDVDDLRRAGVQISRSESWERTAIDFVSQLDSDGLLSALSCAGNLLIRLGISGLIHHSHENAASDLYFDPQYVEGEYRAPAEEGRMFGYGPVICATVAAALYERAKSPKVGQPRLDIRPCLANALGNCRAFFRNGCGSDASNILDRALHWDILANEIEKKKYDIEMHTPMPQIRFTVMSTYEFDPDIYAWDHKKPSWNDKAEAPAGRLTVGIQTDIPVGPTLSRRPSDVVDAIVDRCCRELGNILKDCGVEPATTRSKTPRVGDRRITRWVYSVSPIAAVCAAAGIRVRVWNEASTEPNGAEVQNWEQFYDEFTKAIKNWAAGTPNQPFADNLEVDLKEFGPSPIAARVDFILGRLIQQIHEKVSREMYWRYCWPVCVFGLNEFKVFAHKRIENNSRWRILNTKISNLVEVAVDIVKKGVDKAMSATSPERAFPVARFGELVTVDRDEIESYRSIRNLIQRYTEKKSPPRPLCIAVFGPPGSGKSFGVKQIAGTISGKQKSKSYEFNLAQFTCANDLENALIQIRDDALGGVRPLVFFDEVDSSFDGQSLGWLRHFLSVMQDGEFKHENLKLKIGNPILVFAGGTSSSYGQFTRKELKEDELDEFRAAKGPDFVSRLRGFVDTTGPDPRDTEDDVFIVRRAVMIRSIIERSYKDLLRSDGEPQIDGGVLNALLQVPRYEHGVRSIEAIFEMSKVGTKFEKSDLPPREQLEMHLFRSKEVDSASDFDRLLKER
ncbi:MAG TPA: AAA family ATPase [Planctomycetaceae bacterium]|nr:AAA family ATPase [Planctomycetaceae bacterium]